MGYRAARSFWGGVAAAIIIICNGSGCVTVSTGDRIPYGSLTSCPPLAACPPPMPCVQTPTPSASTASSVTQAPVGSASFATMARPASPVPPLFPPQVVMETGNYREFVAANERQLQRCRAEDDGCAVALFNLGFVYAYEASPYRNLDKAMTYFEELVSRYPESPYALQGKAWRALIRERLTLEGDLRTVKTHLRGKDETIRTLQGQLQRLRELEIDMQEKERELLQLR